MYLAVWLVRLWWQRYALLERYGGRGSISIASPQCRSKTYGRLPIVKRHMKAPKIERQHHKIIRMPSVR